MGPGLSNDSKDVCMALWKGGRLGMARDDSAEVPEE